ncbi:MAG: M20/M25/M40 family metallo-hydrolase [Myxococcota bacterium]
MIKRGLVVAGGLVGALVLRLVIPAVGQPEPVVPVEEIGDLVVNETRAAQSLSRYIRFDTSTPPGISAEEEPPFISYLVETYVEPLGLRHEVLAGRSLLVRFGGSSGANQEPGVLFLSHSDVVPVADNEREAWTHPPFSGAIEDGYVWGRGALDNKGSTICAFEAIAALKALGLAPRRAVRLLVVPDEEIGGVEGVGRVLEDHADRLGDLHAVFDEGSFILPDLVPGQMVSAVAVAEKRFINLRLTVRGEAGHASMPKPQSDAPSVLARALGRLANFKAPPRLTPPVERFLDRMGDNAGFGQRLALRNRWLFESTIRRTLAQKPASDAIMRDTVSLTMLEGGVKANVVPAEASAVLNLRLLPDTDLESFLSLLRAVLSDSQVEIEVLQDWGATPVAPMEGDEWDMLERILTRAVPEAFVTPSMTPGTMDARYFAQRGIPTYRFIGFTVDAQERRSIHGINERVSIANLAQAIRVYAYLMRFY